MIFTEKEFFFFTNWLAVVCSDLEINKKHLAMPTEEVHKIYLEENPNASLDDTRKYIKMTVEAIAVAEEWLKTFRENLAAEEDDQEPKSRIITP